MFRTLRNLIVNIMAAFIRDRDARHKFRNKYKRKSKFRKLRDDNRILFHENKALRSELNKIKSGITRLNEKNLFKYKQGTIFSCRKFLDIPDFAEKYKSLINGLDDESIECVTRILSRMKLIAQQDPGNDKNAWKTLDIYSSKELELMENVRKEFNLRIMQLSEGCFAYKNYLLPIRHFEDSVFYYKHHINKLKNLEKLKHKDFIDVGGFIGDSAIVFTEFTSGKIYSFEAVSKNYDYMLKTIELNNSKNIIPVKIGLGSKDETLDIKIQGSASALTPNTPIYREDAPTETISITTLDNYLKDKDINVGLIKVDIEGFEQEFLKGAVSTIRKFKPALLLSIYHNNNDFFNIKPLVESWNLGYKFKVSRPALRGLSGETLLICECD